MILFFQQLFGDELFSIIFQVVMVLFFFFCCFFAMEISNQILTRDDLFMMSSAAKVSSWILILVVMIGVIIYTRIKSGQELREMNELRPIVLLYEHLTVLQPVLNDLSEEAKSKKKHKDNANH